MTDTLPVFPELAEHQYANLYTYRKTGEAVPTPVWFVILDNTLYIGTSTHSGKVKRIRNFQQVLLEPSDAQGKPLGPKVAGIARIVNDGDEIRRAQAALGKRYGVWKNVIDTAYLVTGVLRGRKEYPAVIAVVPADAPHAPTPRTTPPPAPEPIFPSLTGHQYMNLITYRKTGEAVPTPVWFAIGPDQHKQQQVLYVFTQPASGKVKRIRNNPNVTLEPSDSRGKPLGAAAAGQARIISAADEAAHAEAALAKKYGIQKQLFEILVINGIGRLRGMSKERAYLAIVPAPAAPATETAAA